MPRGAIITFSVGCRIGCSVCRTGTIWGSEMTEKVVWHVVKQYAGKIGIVKLAPHDGPVILATLEMINGQFSQLATPQPTTQ
jgi:hypothetical protein